MYYIKNGREFKMMDSTGFFTNEYSIAKELVFRPHDNWHYETRLIDWCNDTFIKPDENFVDIGAHIGSWTMTCGQNANHTYSFECNKSVYNCLCANLFLKNLSYKIDTYNCGLSNKTGTMNYYRRSVDGGENGLTYLRESYNNVETDVVKVCKLDDLNLENIGFIKIDVEGHEKEVLEGATETLKNNNFPTFIFESWASWRDKEGSCPAIKLRKELFEYIKSLNYKIIPINGWDEQFIAEYERIN